MGDESADEDAFEIEYNGQGEYKLRYIQMRVDVDNAVTPNPPVLPLERSVSPTHSITAEGRSKNPRRLPAIKIPVYSGKIKDWIGWWAQFETIHADDDLDAAVKFTYLRQAVQQGTRAWDLVSSYPPSAYNYMKVVDALKTRFGDKNLLVQVYVREFISLIVETSKQEKGKQIGLIQLYDRIESHLRALETLGVTTEEQGTRFLLPMVESCLPVHVLRAWQRSGLRKNDGKNNSELQRLMLFLKEEVEGETRILLAHQGFVKETLTKENKAQANPRPEAKAKQIRERRPDISTAMGLVTLDANGNCGFCMRAHPTDKCRTATKWSMEERKEKLKASGSCFICLNRGHLARECAAACSNCGGQHHLMLCYRNPQDGETNGGNAIQVRPSQNYQPTQNAHPSLSSSTPTASQQPRGATGGNATLGCANYSCGSDMVYPTLTIGVIGTQGHCRKVRAAIDSLSGNSYIREELAKDLKLKQYGDIMMTHALFDGAVKQKRHPRYAFTVQSMSSSFNMEMEAFGTETICAGIPGLANDEIAREVRKLGICLSDTNNGGTIDVLFGGDIAGKLLSGIIMQLNSGPTAIQTKLGWTLMGRVVSMANLSFGQQYITTSLTNLTSPTALWELETIGIRDPAEKLQKQYEDEIALQHFRDTVKRRKTGGYCVSLPWVEGHPPLPSYYQCAEKRLHSTTKKLVKLEKLEDYDGVFKEWMGMGIIEEVKPAELQRPCTYLPHRAVIKESSATTKVRPVFDASCSGSSMGEVSTPSLNECLVKGPNLLEKIQDLLLRFRVHPVGAIADIKKAFLMIEVAESDRDFLRFLWWDETRSKVRVLRHCRVVFGLNCSPFLLGAVIEHHL